MPTIIDRYMLRQFVQVLVICFLSLVGLYVVVDAFGHLDHFVDYADNHGNLLYILFSYYAYQALAFFNRISGVADLVLIDLNDDVATVQPRLGSGGERIEVHDQRATLGALQLLRSARAADAKYHEVLNLHTALAAQS